MLSKDFIYLFNVAYTIQKTFCRVVSDYILIELFYTDSTNILLMYANLQYCNISIYFPLIIYL